MSRKHRRPSKKPVAELLEGFVEDDRLTMGAMDSAHALTAGSYNGQRVTVKPFRSKHGFVKAQNELTISRVVRTEGFRAVEPIETINFKRQCMALLISKYMPDLIGAHTLSYEADPASAPGQALRYPLAAISSELGKLNGAGFTHGDSQVKNFGLSSPSIDRFGTDQPIIFDFENGVQHASRLGNYKDSVADDISRLTYSLGTRQFGGNNTSEAAEVLREVVLAPYVESPVSEVVGSMALSTIIDHSQANFLAGRTDKALIDKQYAHQARVTAEFAAQ